MNKERKVIKPGTIVFFNRDVEGKELEALSDKSLTVVINGDLSLEEDLSFKGNLYVEGDIDGISRDIIIEGSLNCKGEMEAGDVLITENIDIYNYMYVANIFVDGNFYSNSDINSSKIVVGECLWAEEIDSCEVCVSGDICCKFINANNYDIIVAGDFESEDGVKADCVNVLGKMRISGSIEARVIDVGY